MVLRVALSSGFGVGAGEINLAAGNHDPEFIEDPPNSSAFYVGLPSSRAFGRVQDVDGDNLTVALDPPVPGFSLELTGTYITIHWDGTGAEGSTGTYVSADDGR